MKNKKILVLVILFISFFLTGCDNYKDGNYGEQIVNSWFNYSYGDIDLGKTRRNLEKIKEIETTSCNYFTKYKSNYIYKCKLTYKEIGETLIPLGEVKTKDIYAVLIPYKNNTFTYKVYNSSSEDIIGNIILNFPCTLALYKALN